ncbi:glutaminyl-peptide cyclotransferase [Marinospirillum sp.]|uniref:glutaminyl-peptide cyclotransferase n=1 Tax=Marinospirillum sp. TaxID=2183934 RepID=UPI00384ED8C9
MDSVRLCFLFLTFALVSCRFLDPQQAQATPPVSDFRVLQTYPHDPQAFTQGLLFHEGHLYESTGRYGQSTLRKVDLESGEVVQSVQLPAHRFGEGLALWEDWLIQLTWQAGEARVYDRHSLELLHTFSYKGQGWGLTADDTSLILSDGSATLRFFDPETFTETRRIQVLDQGRAVSRLNELDYVKGEILANVWHSDLIARINPQSGRVQGWIDLQGLLPEHLQPQDSDAVLNGIAWDAENQRLFVTGKLWPKLFAIELIPEPL